MQRWIEIRITTSQTVSPQQPHFDIKIIMKSNAIEFFQILLAPLGISANWLSVNCKTKYENSFIFHKCEINRIV